MSRKRMLILGGSILGLGLLISGLWAWYTSKWLIVEVTPILAIKQERFYLQGTTNLPEGTFVWMTFIADQFHYQQECPIQEGRFSFGPILEAGQSPPPGDYRLTLYTREAFLQPNAVQAKIGAKGQYLRGPYTRNSPATTGRLVYVVFPCHLKSSMEVLGEEIGEFFQDVVENFFEKLHRNKRE